MKLDGEEKSHRQKYSEGWGKEKYSANRMREWDEKMKERKKVNIWDWTWLEGSDREMRAAWINVCISLFLFGFSTLILYLLLYLCSLSSVSFPPLGFQTLECCCFFNISFFPAGSLSSAFLYQSLHLITSLSYFLFALLCWWVQDAQNCIQLSSLYPPFT